MLNFEVKQAVTNTILSTLRSKVKICDVSSLNLKFSVVDLTVWGLPCGIPCIYLEFFTVNLYLTNNQLNRLDVSINYNYEINSFTVEWGDFGTVGWLWDTLIFLIFYAQYTPNWFKNKVIFFVSKRGIFFTYYI